MIEKGNTVDESRNCGNCCHAYNWQGNPANVSQRTGECRRFPPHVIAVAGHPGQIQSVAVFPPIVSTLFCGEHLVKIDRSADKSSVQTVAREFLASQ